MYILTDRDKGTAPVTVQVSSTGTPGHTVSVALSGYERPDNEPLRQPCRWPDHPGERIPDRHPEWMGVSRSHRIRAGPLQSLTEESRKHHSLHLHGSESRFPHHLREQERVHERFKDVDSKRREHYPGLRYPEQGCPGHRDHLRCIHASGGDNAYVYTGCIMGLPLHSRAGLLPENHQVRISLSGFQEWVGTVYLTSGATVTVTQTLRVGTPTPTRSPTQTSGTGSVAVTSNPSGGQVFMDTRD